MNNTIIPSQFNRPAVTFQDSIQKDYVKYLNGYDDALDMSKVPLGTHIRYITIDKNNKKVFRLGGFLQLYTDKFILLSNNNFKWSVPINHYAPDSDTVIFETIFFKKVSRDEKMIKIINKLFEEIKSIKEKLNLTVDDFEKEIEDDLNELYSDYDIEDTDLESNYNSSFDTESITSIESIKSIKNIPRIPKNKTKKTRKNKKDIKDDDSVISSDFTQPEPKNKPPKNTNKKKGGSKESNLPINNDYNEVEADTESIVNNDESVAGQVLNDDEFNNIAAELSKRIKNNNNPQASNGKRPWYFFKKKY
jgi:hypothetical protein